MSDRVTSFDVAQRAGVSRSAVSRVFTPGASVSKDTAMKVRAVADELGYRPNVLARSLNSGRSRIIGLVVAYLDNQFYPSAIERLSQHLEDQGYHVLVFLAANSKDDTDKVMDEVLDYKVDGIIAASVSLSNGLAKSCEDAGIPVVLFNRMQQDDWMSAVTSDNVSGAYRIAQFLVAGGHQRIAHIAGWKDASTQRDREAGFISGLIGSGQKLFAHGVTDFDREKAKDVARAMFDRSDRPDAVFCANDHIAFAVMDVLRFELGLRVPEDVSVVGYDDVPIASWPSYDLTTIRQPVDRMAKEAVSILLGRLENSQSKPRRVALDGPFILRGSARIPEGWCQ